MSRRVKIYFKSTLELLNVALYGTDRNGCQSEEEKLSFKAMYQLFLENTLFQVQALNHLELILLSRAAWSGHAYETCLSALWKISHITSLLELLFCYFKEMVGFDQLWFPKEKNLPSLYALQKIEYNFVVQMSHLPSPVHLACHQERRDDKLPLSDVAQPWLRWWWLFGWQARENSFGSESQCFLTLHREELKAWSGSQPPILLNFLALASLLLQQYITIYRL